MRNDNLPFPQNFIRIGGNDGTESEYERMNVFHVEIISRHCIRNGVICKNLWDVSTSVNFFRSLHTRFLDESTMSWIYFQNITPEAAPKPFYTFLPGPTRLGRIWVWPWPRLWVLDCQRANRNRVWPNGNSPCESRDDICTRPRCPSANRSPDGARSVRVRKV